MAILPSYKFDVYISYRHSDSVREWVMEFIEKLQQELDASLKDRLSVYVDKRGVGNEIDSDSFKKERTENLRSLIFIPVLSNTYCDSSKFNWEEEFMQFKTSSANDELG